MLYIITYSLLYILLYIMLVYTGMLCRNLFWWIQKTFLKILVIPTIVRIWYFKPFRESMTSYTHVGELQGYLYSNFLFLNNFTIFSLVLSLTFTSSEGTPNNYWFSNAGRNQSVMCFCWLHRIHQVHNLPWRGDIKACLVLKKCSSLCM